ncbi:MAG: hypothetical protein MR427_04795 [Roseburia sp.]|nr:hypothetical protein [Roseburia sp.]
MFDYMHGLQTKFFKEPIFPDLEEEISQLHQDLSHHMDKETRKKLLRLIDTVGELQSRVSLASFIAGFRLAAGIAKESSSEEPYSYEKEEEDRISKIR